MSSAKVQISDLRLTLPTESASCSDKCVYVSVSVESEATSLDQVKLQKTVETVSESLPTNSSSEEYLTLLVKSICGTFGQCNISISIRQPNLYSSNYGHSLQCDKTGSSTSTSFVHDIETECIIGLYAEERHQKQPVVVGFDVTPACSDDQLSAITESVYDFIAQSTYHTVEEAAEDLADLILHFVPTKSTVNIQWTKPAASINSSNVGVNLFKVKPINDRIFLALGSNLGYTAKNIQNALGMLCEDGNVKLVQTSGMYQTDPMYITEQPKFLNAVCEVKTTLTPMELLKAIKIVEKMIGRRKTTINSAREVDIDILVFGEVSLNDEILTIPHKLMHEREFVLRPLAEMCPEYFLVREKMSISQLLKLVPPSGVMPATQVSESICWHWGKKTYVMGILNIALQSYPIEHKSNTVNNDVQKANFMIDCGARCVDISGRIKSAGLMISDEKEELQRVIPVIKELKSQSFTEVISIDTSSAYVARKAVEAGANIINDVTGGCEDPEMLKVMAELGVPVILMFSKNSHVIKTGDLSSVVQDTCSGLSKLVTNALKAGVFRWNIILDPGISFIKEIEGNMMLLVEFSDAISKHSVLKGLPYMIGASRETSIGHIDVQTMPTEFNSVPAVVSTYSIFRGTNILRVHDVGSTVQIARMADALRKAELSVKKML